MALGHQLLRASEKQMKSLGAAVMKMSKMLEKDEDGNWLEGGNELEGGEIVDDGGGCVEDGRS